MSELSAKSPPESMHVVRIKVDSVVPLPKEWPPSVVWLRFLDEELHELPASDVPPVRVDLGPLLRPEGGDQILTVPALPQGKKLLWSFWDAEQGGCLLLQQERDEDDLVAGIQQLMAWWGVEWDAMMHSARATVPIGTTTTIEFDGGVPEVELPLHDSMPEQGAALYEDMVAKVESGEVAEFGVGKPFTWSERR